jgi:hypothetical protein
VAKLLPAKSGYPKQYVMTNLNETILSKCRDQVNNEEMGKYLHGEECLKSEGAIQNKAALMAMEEQAKFFRWAIGELWWPHQNGKWYPAEDLLNSPGMTEEQLYEEYGRGKG